MIRCDKHRKDHVGGCMWCGRKLCEFCIAKRDGKKFYCDKCCGTLGGIRRERLPQVAQRQPLSPTGKRFKLKNGYLVMDGGE